MNNLYLFGAGKCGKEFHDFIEGVGIAAFLDNSDEKDGTEYNGTPIFLYSKKEKEIDHNTNVIVCVGENSKDSIISQLKADGFTNVTYFEDYKKKIILDRINTRPDYIKLYNKVTEWIKNHFLDGRGISVSNINVNPYPEVTGYYIPTLITWGYKDLAIKYARWLCNIQTPIGGWCDPDLQKLYIFDTAQVLKGLLAIRKYLPEVDEHIIRGCDFIISHQDPESGRIIPAAEDAFEDENTCNEAIHLYCISPIIEAGKVLKRDDYLAAGKKAKEYYLKNYRGNILNFRLLSHFQAYVIESLYDLGELDLCEEALTNLLKYQKGDGSIPAYHDVNWICSTGMFQVALVCFKMGHIDEGKKAFYYICKYQNPSGGWYGSYVHPDFSDEKNTYFPNGEISWACKYFLDALYSMNKADFDEMAPLFKLQYNPNDGRYSVIRNFISSHIGKYNRKIADIGCGKGGYLRGLIEDYPDNYFYGVDISDKVLEFVDLTNVETKTGTLTSIPFEDEVFDLTYTCEALEHAIDIRNAIKEMARVTKSGGYIIVIDKNKGRLGDMEIEKWEQWFDENELKEIMCASCDNVVVDKEITYERDDKGLFYAWIGQVKKG